MVYLPLPNRLKSRTGGQNSTSNSRSTSPNPPAAKSGAMDTSGPESPKVNGLTLKVVVLRGNNLAARDKNGTSDPYLVLTLGDSKQTTQYVPKTLNPEWNTTLTMPVSSVKDLLLECICWDKDRFGKDYLGEFDLALEDVFSEGKTQVEPTWYPLKSKRSGGKKSFPVSGEILLQFTLFDSTNTSATPQEVLEKLKILTGGLDISGSVTPTQTTSGASGSPDDLDDMLDEEEEPSDETDDPTKQDAAEKRKRILRLKGLKKKKRLGAYEFGNGSDVVGIIFLELTKVTDLPPERNMTRTSFDMDPFIVASLGKKTYRTRVIRHNLNPVFNEKMIFHVLRNEQSYSMSFTVIDRDKLSGNDFVASTVLPVQEITNTAPEANPETGLYVLEDPDVNPTPAPSKKRFKIPLSRSNSSQSINKTPRPPLGPRALSGNGNGSGTSTPTASAASNPLSQVTSDNIPQLNVPDSNDGTEERVDPGFHTFTIPLKLKNTEKWEEKHSPQLYIKAKYLPYPALRQQFWRAMLKQYDTDESGCIGKVELTTMLDALGSTLKESTIDSFFGRFGKNAEENILTYDEAVICLEDQLKEKAKPSVADKVKGLMPDSSTIKNILPTQIGGQPTSDSPSISGDTAINEDTPSGVSTQTVPPMDDNGEEGEYIDKDDLNDKGEEHVVEIQECPICHQPRLQKRSDADIITHIATCASSDWRQVNEFVMGGFVTSSQAQRKWYSKVITKISYGGYKIGANSANILVQDRITGQINEERMSVYVRLGIRLLYKGLKSKDMEAKKIRKLLRSLSIKQGIKYDDPASKAEIPKFINFHQLNLDEVKLPLEEFKNFNEFFYRELKPGARPCSAPDNPHIIVSPADCRTVVFNRIDEATKIWVKGREFSLERLLGNAYPEDAKRYTNGALGIFRLAPQDYHRFHIPVDGVLGTPKTIEGEYYTVNPMAIRSALDVYGENVRVLVPIDSVAHGRVMVVCVGAMMVGSTVITRKAGDQVHRAEELGYFKFGGSTVLLLFEEGVMKFDDDLANNSSGALETLIRVGMSIGHSPQQPQFTPDMRKKDEDITESELADAKRRIEGSLAPAPTNAPTASLAG
ncbi:phosphatidylserine decarboxylase-like protein [Xylogone sp. PMI_703]|nr:phosphatidylserine decarboxylase-like protein [Xylogone sp. PMI_703]